MRERPAGDDGLLLDFGADEGAGRLASQVADALRVAAGEGRLVLMDVVAGAQTVLVEAPPGHGVNELGVRRVVHDVLADTDRRGGADDDGHAPVVIPTVYDGADLAEAADALSCSTARIVAAHTSILWYVQFMGFAPGFGYLAPTPGSDVDDVALLARLGRRTQSRPAVPAGSVAVAAGYSAVYPRSSPGGWHLLGRTAVPMWDSAAAPPSPLTTGATVRFEEVS